MSRGAPINLESRQGLNAEVFLLVCERQTIADSNHAFDPETEGLKSAPEPMDVHPETQRVERRVTPRGAPDFLRGNYPVGAAREPREDKKLLERERNPISAARDVVLIVFNPEVAVIVNVADVVVAGDTVSCNRESWF